MRSLVLFTVPLLYFPTLPSCLQSMYQHVSLSVFLFTDCVFCFPCFRLQLVSFAFRASVYSLCILLSVFLFMFKWFQLSVFVFLFGFGCVRVSTIRFLIEMLSFRCKSTVFYELTLHLRNALALPRATTAFGLHEGTRSLSA